MKTEKDNFYIRQIDPQGRLVLPKEIRDRLGIVVGTPLRLSIDGNNVIMKIASPSCFFCGNSDSLITLKEKHVCEKCLEKLNMKKQIEEE